MGDVESIITWRQLLLQVIVTRARNSFPESSHPIHQNIHTCLGPARPDTTNPSTPRGHGWLFPKSGEACNCEQARTSHMHIEYSSPWHSFRDETRISYTSRPEPEVGKTKREISYPIRPHLICRLKPIGLIVLRLLVLRLFVLN